jgi:hypothetical protein
VNRRAHSRLTASILFVCSVARYHHVANVDVSPLFCLFPLLLLLTGESEYLFVPYSVFTIVDFKWSTNKRVPHRVVLEAAHDNLDEDEDLPLAPWY